MRTTHGFRVMAAKKTTTMPGITDFLYTRATTGCREGLSLFYPKFKEHTATSNESLCFHDAVTPLKKPKCFAICCNIGEILMALHYFEN